MQNIPSLDWSLNEWLDFLENRHFKEVQLRIINPKKVAKKLNLLSFDIPVITISGTNGKGSTVASLSAIYKAAGYRVGAFTSPHLIKFNERISVNDTPISDDELCSAFHQIENMRGDVGVTYFEASFLAALLHFKNSKLDVIILEVGVGGRLDATNIIDADLTIITTVDIDHVDYLGDNKEAIGFEKAGIMRAGKACIYADFSPPNSIIEYAQKIKTNLIRCGIDYFYKEDNNKLIISKAGIEDIILPLPTINEKSLSAAIIASVCLTDKLPVTFNHIMNATQGLKLAGRLQLVDKGVKILYDVSHNPQSVSLLSGFIEKNKPTGDVHAIFSGLKDKDLCGLISPLKNIVNYWYPTLLSGKRAATADMLLEALQIQTNLSLICHKSPMDAFNSAIKKAKIGDLIVIYGSFILVGAVMGNLEYESSYV